MDLVKLLLDTHTLLWWLADDPTLSDGAARAIVDEDNAVYVSAASAWEISIKSQLGKLDAPEDLAEAMRLSELEPLAITIEQDSFTQWPIYGEEEAEVVRRGGA